MDVLEYKKMKALHNTHWWFRGKKDIINSIIGKYNPKTKNLLDIGCGDGYFFDKYSGVGIEPCDLFQKDNILNCQIENVHITDKFDTILCLDVLEHLEDDKEIHRFLNDNLNPGGVAIITVPAHRKLYSEHDKSHHHYRRYDRADLDKLLEKYDRKIYYYNSILYPLEYLIRKINKGKDNMRPVNPFINAILYYIFSFEKHVFKLFPTGMSLIAIVKKDSNLEA